MSETPRYTIQQNENGSWNLVDTETGRPVVWHSGRDSGLSESMARALAASMNRIDGRMGIVQGRPKAAGLRVVKGGKKD
ncbi:hypothetical protein PYH37_000448 [Sinorhizobium numidicum]|uniref:DUF2188 domain-containing protein n=1 Tax=Sinorhizobium numidicum TaxID=680248 RepID=A0ABY8CUU9_9HYPH|nr:hypothetical protein [Sinorhizobium numidicum]WEX75106.1 hypothetical protein PYH37_000448 [Sinorhizobium numidicum]WEX81100.1 hypothetical protein PYH38_000450 [Sinorhizobium numidicum]